MYNKILIPTDGSGDAASAVDYGLGLAKFHGASVRLVSVQELPPIYPLPVGSFEVPAQLYPPAATVRKAMLTELSVRGEQAGVKVETAVLYGDPADAILADAEQANADLILLAAHPHGRLASFLLSSVSQGILRHAPCPVLVCGEETRKHELAASVATTQPREAGVQ